MVDGLVDLLDGLFKLLARDAVIAGELLLERIHIPLKVGHIHLLAPNHRQLVPVVRGAHRGVAKKRDHRDEKLRPDYIHFIIPVRNVNNAVVVIFAVGLQKGHQNRVFAVFLAAVLVKLREEILISVLRGRLVELVLHLEHDGQKLVAVVIALAEDEVALGAAAGVVVLLKIRLWKSRHAQLVKLGQAVLFQALAHHLCGLFRLKILVKCDLIVLRPQLLLVLLLLCAKLGLPLGLRRRKVVFPLQILRLQLTLILLL